MPPLGAQPAPISRLDTRNAQNALSDQGTDSTTHSPASAYSIDTADCAGLLVTHACALCGVAEVIAAARSPYSALNWLRTGAAAAVLADVAAGRTAFTHQALDAHPRQRAADYLRHMLVAGGVLPALDEALARVERWSRDMLDAIDHPADRRTQPFREIDPGRIPP